MTSLTPKDVRERFRQARDRRSLWEAHWRECYDYVLPQRGGSWSGVLPGGKRTERVFDGTGPDAVDQLSASLMAHLTPPSGRWFDLVPGPAIGPGEFRDVSETLEHATSTILSHFDCSNFAVEVHQCYLDLVTAGTASLMFEETELGEPSAFRFSAVPLFQVALEEGASGQLDTTFRRCEMTIPLFLERYPQMASNEALLSKSQENPVALISILEAVIPNDTKYLFLSIIDDDRLDLSGQDVLAEGAFSTSPFINFRWLKAPGEVYGRSPVMKALPDIKTANKVVELILKNASIAVTGIWQADDDGVLNPATIKLVPGAIIPKAVGSAGLTPLAAPGRFDVSELVLDQLRERIRKALFVDQLGQISGPRMTATEVLERAAAMARVLGATFGRLQTEFMMPLISRAISILSRRGEIPGIPLDGRVSQLRFRTPHARYQAQLEAQNTMLWLSAIRDLGPEAFSVVDSAAAARWLARAFGVPGELLHSHEQLPVTDRWCDKIDPTLPIPPPGSDADVATAPLAVQTLD